MEYFKQGLSLNEEVTNLICLRQEGSFWDFKKQWYPYMAVTAINLDFWNSLTEEQQQIITEALENAEEKCFTEWIKENDETAREVCSQEGVEINVIEDVDSFRDAVSGLYDEYEAKGDLIKNFIESVEAKQ